MYRDETKETHKLLFQDKVDAYDEARILLLQSLHKLHTAPTVAKLTECNPQFQRIHWSPVTVDVDSKNVFMNSLNEQGQHLLKQLKDLNTADENRPAVPKPKRPSNKYYVDIVINRE